MRILPSTKSLDEASPLNAESEVESENGEGGEGYTPTVIAIVFSLVLAVTGAFYVFASKERTQEVQDYRDESSSVPGNIPGSGDETSLQVRSP